MGQNSSRHPTLEARRLVIPQRIPNARAWYGLLWWEGRACDCALPSIREPLLGLGIQIRTNGDIPLFIVQFFRGTPPAHLGEEDFVSVPARRTSDPREVLHILSARGGVDAAMRYVFESIERQMYGMVCHEQHAVVPLARMSSMPNITHASDGSAFPHDDSSSSSTS